MQALVQVTVKYIRQWQYQDWLGLITKTTRLGLGIKSTELGFRQQNYLGLGTKIFAKREYVM